MTPRQQRLYRDCCDLYKITDSINEPTYKDIKCLLERRGIHKYGNSFSELTLNQDRWYFPLSQSIEENWVICLKTKDHPEKDQRWLIRGTPKCRGGKIGHWEVTAEQHFVVPNPLM